MWNGFIKYVNVPHLNINKPLRIIITKDVSLKYYKTSGYVLSAIMSYILLNDRRVKKTRI